MVLWYAASMRLDDFFEKYPTQESFLARIEKTRWGRYGPRCPLCRKPDVGRKKEKGRVGRWNCYACKSSFTVLSGTPFQGTHIPLQKWFESVNLILNGNKVLSSHEMGFLLGVNQTTALAMQKKIAREIYIGGERGLRRIIGTSKRCFIRRPRRPFKKRTGKPVIT